MTHLPDPSRAVAAATAPAARTQPMPEQQADLVHHQGVRSHHGNNNLQRAIYRHRGVTP